MSARLRVGLVCPYSWDVPGGVQVHVRDLAEALLAMGHEVSVLAPADDETPVPPYVVPAGHAVPVPYNGSIARVNFGPLSAARVRRWLRDGDFDVLHVHEPGTPSLSLLAVWAADGPIVATFHTANSRSRAMSAAYGILQPALEKISARIAVSEQARATLVQHFGGDPVLIPNGLYVDRFAGAPERADLRGEGATVCFLGRLDEPRKGLSVLLDAWPSVVKARPGARLFVAGRGDVAEATARLPADVRESVTFLGGIDDATKASMLATSDVYVAPHTGGESFGIVLVEAMAAGTTVLASDLPAFSAVLDDGRLGVLFPMGDCTALSARLIELLDDPGGRAEFSSRAAAAVRRYDWSQVGRQVVSVYEMVTASGVHLAEHPGTRG